MKTLFKYLLYSFTGLTMLIGTFAHSQITVRGKIIDKKDKSPIQHVSVTEQDADNRVLKGVTTDIDGNFAFKITSVKNKLSFSYIGYKTDIQDIKDRRVFNITMEQGSEQLNEVIVLSNVKSSNGLLSVNERDLTTASSKIDAKSLEEMQSASIDQALQGRLSGVDITATSGDPGAGMSIRIRGTSSINAGTNPLIVVDGMPYETDIPSDFNFGTADEQGYAALLNVAPSDIKDINVLKDAAATAMWGSRAANGVLIINTKRGSIGKPVVTYTFTGSVSKPPNPFPLLNGNQYSQLIPEEYMNKTGTPLNTLTVKEFAYDPSDLYYYKNYSNNTDWLGAISQTGTTQNHNLSLTGGGQKAKYFVSMGYYSQSGTTIGTNLTRANVRVNLDYTVSERIRFRTDIAFTNSDNPKSYTPGATVSGLTSSAAASYNLRNVALNKMPNMSIYEYNDQGVLTGNYFSPASNIQGYYPTTYNPVAMAKMATNRVKGNRVTPHFNLQYDIIPHVLVATGDVQFDINNTKSNTFLPQIATGRPSTETVSNMGYDGDLDVFNVQTKVNLLFNPKMPEKHAFTSVLSIQTSDTKSVSYQAQTSNTASSLLQDASSASRTIGTGLGVAAGNTQTRTVGALINGQYGYKDRYIINVGLRGDGSSRFGPGQRYGLFPSVSTRWRLSDESFLKPVKFINDLSIRASYGGSGNAPTTDYTFYNMYSTYGYTYAGLSGVYPSTMQLNHLKWEVVHGANLGFNLIMLERRVNADLEIYKNRTTDLLYKNLTIPGYTGYGAVPIMNVGTMDNQGWEFNIMTTPVKSKDWTVDFNFNISHNENIIRSISPYFPNKSGDATTNGSYITLLQVNNPFGSIYGYKYKGVYKDASATVATDAKGSQIVGPNGDAVQMLFNYPTTSYMFQPGDARYEDINHDGNINYQDVVYLGNSNPKYSGGFGPTITFKRNLKISAFFNFRTGYQIVNGTDMTMTKMYAYNNQSTAVLRRWRNPGDVTDIPRALWNSGYNWLGSDRYVQDASFLRFRTVTVRYNFSNEFAKKLKIRSFSTYVTAENLYTFTRYRGQDPEVSTNSSDPFKVITDNSTTPPSLTLTLGISASF
jgi:TonB-linked SusC/RagA family outer membrane protein